ncbi:MAG: hypothetical protein ACJAYC_002089 [Halieaceae bacterium]|jgi:hypothetical protein
MSEQNDSQRPAEENRLNPEDQAKVDVFVSTGINSVERKSFKPLRLLIILSAVVILLSILSQLLAKWGGIY